MNELTLLGGVELEVARDNANLMTERLKKAVIDQNKLTPAEELRTEANKLIKGYEDSIKKAQDELIKTAFGEQMEKVNEFLTPLKNQAKEYASLVLEASKAKKKAKCKDQFDTLNDGGDDGEIFDFEKLYDPKWGEMKQLDQLKAIKSKLDRERRKPIKERYDLIIEANKDDWEELLAYLGKKGIQYAII